jgi:hypothetical protein
MAGLEQARAAKASLSAELADHPAVTGVGIARVGDGYELKVDLREPAGVPAEVDGVPVRAAVVGRITAE